MRLLTLLHFPNRIGRAQWWLGMAVVGAIISGALALGGDHNALLMVFAGLISLAIFIPASIARLHDRNRSAEAGFTCFLIAGVFAKIIRQSVETDHRWMAVAVVGLSFAIYAVIELGFLRGTVGRNPYGPDPLDDTAQTA